MLKPKSPSRVPARIDLEAMRETLLYLESDCRDVPALKAVAAAIETAIEEIEQLEAVNGTKPAMEVVGSHFLPAGL